MLELYMKRCRIEQEKERLLEQVHECDCELEKIKEDCSHPISFRFSDKDPHKIGPISYCFCPLCRKIEKINFLHPITNSSFKDSKIVSLLELDLKPTLDVLITIEEEVLNSYSYYYDKDNIESDLAQKMSCSLLEKEQKKKLLQKNK